MNPHCCHDIQSLDLDCMDYVYPPAALLPVELLSFDAVAPSDANEISWRTATESEVEAFIVERSDARKPDNFKNIGSAFPQTDVVGLKNYSLIDQNTLERNFYRLKVLNLEGTFDLSGIISIYCDSHNELSIFPTIAERKCCDYFWSNRRTTRHYGYDGHAGSTND